MGRLKRLISRAAQQIASLPMKAIGPHLRTDILDHLTEEASSVVKIPGNQIRFCTPSPLLLARASSVLSKEADTIHWIDGFEKRTVFWDVGANVGVYTLYAAIQKRVSVLAFEPSAANFHVLSRNIHLNELGDLATAYCIAFSNRSELGMLNMASASMGAAISQFGRSGEMSRYWEGQTPTASHGMIGFTIDSFVAQFNPPFPNYLKLDVDGLEPRILEGARVTLRDTRLRSLLVELSISRESECHNALLLLEEAGFRFVSRGATQGTQTESAANHLFQRAACPVTSNQADSKHSVCNAESVRLAK
jgi:FkbM family methyltransferase